MARPPGADDEYQELQKRFQILESERKNLFEHTQLEVKKNKEALAKLKKENKELRSSLSSLMYAYSLPTQSHARTPARTCFHSISSPFLCRFCRSCNRCHRQRLSHRHAFHGLRLNLRVGACGISSPLCPSSARVLPAVSSLPAGATRGGQLARILRSASLSSRSVSCGASMTM